MDTTAGSVMMSARALSLIESNITQKQHRKERNVMLRLKKEVERTQKKAAAHRENIRMREAAMKRRTEMAGLGLGEFQSQLRSIEERRAAAQI